MITKLNQKIDDDDFKKYQANFEKLSVNEVKNIKRKTRILNILITILGIYCCIGILYFYQINKDILSIFEIITIFLLPFVLFMLLLPSILKKYLNQN